MKTFDGASKRQFRGSDINLTQKASNSTKPAELLWHLQQSYTVLIFFLLLFFVVLAVFFSGDLGQMVGSRRKIIECDKKANE
jgi:hypothetical protein